MSLLKIFIVVFSSGIDVYINFTLFSALLGVIKYSSKVTNVGYLLYYLLSSIFAISFSNPILLMIVSFIMAFSVSFMFNSHLLFRIYASTIFTILGVLSEVLSGILLAMVSQRSVEVLSTNIVYYIEGVMVSKVILFLIVKAIQYKKLPKALRLSIKHFLPVMSLPFTSMFIIYLMSEYAYAIEQSRSIILAAVAAVMLIITNLLVFYLLEKQIRQEAAEKRSVLAKQQLQYQTRYYREIAEKYKLSNKTVHDTKNLLFAISILLEKNDIEKAKSKIDELTKSAFGAQDMIKSGNDALDALLNSKVQMIQAMHIDFKPNIFINAKNRIEDIDLCIIIGNALDNAIEACSKISNRQERYISLRIMQNNDLLTIEMMNTSIEEPTRDMGRIVTAKSDTALHGFGLQSIEETVSKYNGNLSVSQANGVFTLKIYVHNEIS